eukprot:4675179-Pleurochrysis_carterae.AAC.1
MVAAVGWAFGHATSQLRRVRRDCTQLARHSASRQARRTFCCEWCGSDGHADAGPAAVLGGGGDAVQ